MECSYVWTDMMDGSSGCRGDGWTNGVWMFWETRMNGWVDKRRIDRKLGLTGWVNSWKDK